MSLKRYGDGFVEQQQVNDQIMAMTGRRYLSGYSDTETEYLGLMEAGVAFAKAYQLTPGVALSAEQMALMTTDMVWLVAQTVTLPDGSTTQALVPEVYVRQTASGDLAPSGALMAGANVVIHTAGDLVNSGSIRGDTVEAEAANITNSGHIAANQGVLLQASNDLVNVSGSIMSSAGSVSLTAGRDIVLQTRTLQTEASVTTASGTSVASRTAVDRVATVQAGQEVLIAAGRDMTILGAEVNAAGNLQITSGRDLSVAAVQGSNQIATKAVNGMVSQGRSGYLNESSVTQQASTLKAGGNLTAVAGTDAGQASGQLSIAGSNLAAGQDVALQGTSVSVAAAKASQSIDIQSVQSGGYNRAAKSDETRVGGSVTAGNKLTVQSTVGSVSLSGANLTAQTGQVALTAAKDVTIAAVTTQHSSANESYLHTHSALSSKTSTSASSTTSTQVEASIVSGDSVLVQAGRDVLVQGSNVAGTQDVAIAAARNLTITSAVQTSSSTSSASEQKSGLMGSGAGIMIGSRSQDQQQAASPVTNVGSTIGSTGGNVTLVAGAAYTQTASQVLAVGKDAGTGNVGIQAQSVVIDAATDTSSSNQAQHFKQSGVTVAFSNSLVSAVQGAVQVGEAASKASDPRMQLLAAASVAMTAKDTVSALSKDPTSAASVGVNISLGTSKSASQSQATSSTAVGSKVAAAGDLTIAALGAGTGSTLSVTGSDISAGTAAVLKADGAITLQAAKSTSTTSSSNSGSSASVGVGFNVGAGSGNGVTLNASASASKGNADGSDTSYTNTHVSGSQISLQSGGDTTLKGAVVQAGQVIANVGGNLNIQSLQDTSTYVSHSTSIGASGSIGVGTGSLSVSASTAKVNAQYASVTEQSGIQAGDGGFQVKVAGNTDLKAGVISSTQAAVDAGKNTLTTATLTTSTLSNTSVIDASSVSASVGTTGGSAGAMTKSGSEASTTRAGVSTAAITLTDTAGQLTQTGQDATTAVASLDRGVRTGKDTSGALAAQTDVQALQSQVQAGAAVVQQFGAQATKAVGDYAQTQTDQAKKLQTQADQETDLVKKQQLQDQADQLMADWGDNGTLRVLAHAAVGGLTGGVGGALGAATGTLAAPQVASALATAGVDSTLSSALTGLASTLVGGVVGGVTGGATGAVSGAVAGFNEVENNFLSHQARDKLNALRAKKDLTLDEKRELVLLETSDQMSDELLAKQRSGVPLTETETFNLGVYLGAYQQQTQAEYGDSAPAKLIAVQAAQSLLKNGSPTATDSYPYAGDSASQSAYMAKLRANQGIFGVFTSPPDSANRDLFNTAKRDSGMGGSLFDGIVPNDAYLPSELLNSAAYATVDALRNSVLASGGYLAATAVGASEQTKQNVAATLSQLSDVGASLILPKTNLSPVTGTTVAAPGPAVDSIRTGTYEGAKVSVDESRFPVNVEKNLPIQSGTLTGTPELPRKNADAEQIRGITRQNEAAVTLSQHGLDIQQLSNNSNANGSKNPDFLINGEVADVYSPTSGNVQQIFQGVSEKANPKTGKAQQAPNIVINLADSNINASEIAQFIARNQIPKLDRILIIKDNQVISVSVGGR